MESKKLAVTIGLIFFSASVAIPVEGHSADLFNDLASELAKAAIREAQQESTLAKRPSTAITPSETARIQEALNKNGYPAGPVDGIPGGKTDAAIRAYQRDNGWQPTGILTADQRAQLFGLGVPGAAAVATGLVPLLLDRGGLSGAGTTSTAIVTPPLESDGLNSKEVKRTRTSGNTGSTTGSTGLEPGQNPTATHSGAVLERNASAATNRETLDGELTNEQALRRKQRERFDNGGSPAVVGATNNPETTATATRNEVLVPDATQRRQVPSTRTLTPDGDCTIASRRAGRCVPSQ